MSAHQLEYYTPGFPASFVAVSTVCGTADLNGFSSETYQFSWLSTRLCPLVVEEVTHFLLLWVGKHGTYCHTLDILCLAVDVPHSQMLWVLVIIVKWWRKLDLVIPIWMLFKVVYINTIVCNSKNIVLHIEWLPRLNVATSSHNELMASWPSPQFFWLSNIFFALLLNAFFSMSTIDEVAAIILPVPVHQEQYEYYIMIMSKTYTWDIHGWITYFEMILHITPQERLNYTCACMMYRL